VKRVARSSGKTRPSRTGRGLPRFPMPAAGGWIFPAPEYNAPFLFSINDLNKAIAATGAEPVSDLDIDIARARISEIIQDFVTVWSALNTSPSGDTMHWAREVKNRAHALLEIMYVEPGNYRSIFTPDGVKVQRLIISQMPTLRETASRTPPPGESIDIQSVRFEDEVASEIRRVMRVPPPVPFPVDQHIKDATVGLEGEQASAIRRRLGDVLNAASRAAADEFLSYESEAMRAIHLALLGTSYIARLAGARAEYDETRKGRHRKADVPLIQLVEDINRVYPIIFREEGTVITSAYGDHARTGAAIDFTQAIMRHIANALPDPPSRVEWAGMRDAVWKLADSRKFTTSRIRQARSKKWRGDT
jgi:hypothetical protein